MNRQGESRYGPTLRTLRERIGITQLQMSDLLDLSLGHLSRIENQATHAQTGLDHRMKGYIYLQALGILRQLAAEKIVDLQRLVEEIDSGIYE